MPIGEVPAPWSARLVWNPDSYLRFMVSLRWMLVSASILRMSISKCRSRFLVHGGNQDWTAAEFLTRPDVMHVTVDWGTGHERTSLELALQALSTATPRSARLWTVMD